MLLEQLHRSCKGIRSLHVSPGDLSCRAKGWLHTLNVQLARLVSEGFVAAGGGIARPDLISSADFGAVYISQLGINQVTGRHTAFDKVMYSSAATED
jgi:hypothetical protein